MFGTSVLWIGPRNPDADTLRHASAAGFQVYLADSVDDGRALLESQAPAVVVVAQPGPIDGARVRELAARAPMSWLVALVDTPEDIADALASGANDAVPFDQESIATRLLVWARAAGRVGESSHLVRELGDRLAGVEAELAMARRESRQLRELAHRDELTGLGNRRSFRSHVDQAVEVVRRYGGVISVVAADLDGMKLLNDSQGHPAGDAALARVAEVFRASLRGADHAARLGGDEFAVCLPSTGTEAARRVANRIRERISTLLLPGGHRLTMSMGVATVEGPKPELSADDLLSRADAALYDAKRSGRDRVAVDGAPVTSPERSRAGGVA